MSEEYPLYPDLSEAGKEEAQRMIDQFKESMEKVCKETLSNLYCDVVEYIESDSWTNYRNQLLDGFRNYDNRKVQGEHDFKAIRQEIYKEFRDDIIKDLNQDMLAEIEGLKKTIEIIQRDRRPF